MADDKKKTAETTIKSARKPRGPNQAPTFGKVLGNMIDSFDKLEPGMRSQVLDLLVTRYEPGAEGARLIRTLEGDVEGSTFAPNSAE